MLLPSNLSELEILVIQLLQFAGREMSPRKIFDHLSLQRKGYIFIKIPVRLKANCETRIMVISFQYFQYQMK